MATADLSGVPNSGELTALASKFFTADPGAISSIGDTWGTAGSNSADEMNALNGTVDQIKANWTGAGSESFGNWVTSFDKSSQNISQALTIASNALKNAASQLEKAKANVNTIISQVASDAKALQGEIAQLQAAKKDVTNLEAQLESLAKNASPKVQAEIKQAEAELGDVITDLNDAINLAEGNFSAIKVPSGVPVNPNIPSNPPTTLTTATTPATGGSPAGGGTGGGTFGGGPGGSFTPASPGTAVSGSAMQNGMAVYKYLRAHGWTPMEAAGAVASMYGESGLNPEISAMDTNGLMSSGIMQWNGSNYSIFVGGAGPTGNATADLNAQLPGILNYVNGVHGGGAISSMNGAGSVLSASQIFSSSIEKAGISDAHTAGAQLAAQIASQVDHVNLAAT